MWRRVNRSQDDQGEEVPNWRWKFVFLDGAKVSIASFTFQFATPHFRMIHPKLGWLGVGGTFPKS